MKAVEGRYLYGITDWTDFRSGNVGLYGKKAYSIQFKDISAIVSDVPYKEPQANAEGITAHQLIIQESRTSGTTLPVRFGIMFKSDENVRQMLAKSYKDLKSKMRKLKGKDEFGLKIIIDLDNIKKISADSQDSAEVKKIRKEMLSSGEGAAYFLKMKMDEAIRTDTYKRLEQLSLEIHNELAETAEETSLLKSDFDEIILNAAYLIHQESASKFHGKIDALKKRHESEGLVFHTSGPWAPYSFC